MSPIGDMSAKADIFESITPEHTFSPRYTNFHLTETRYHGSPASRAHLIRHFVPPSPQYTVTFGQVGKAWCPLILKVRTLMLPALIRR